LTWLSVYVTSAILKRTGVLTFCTEHKIIGFPIVLGSWGAIAYILFTTVIYILA